VIGKMEKKYALFDWDNTVRKGYTLYSWVDYLCEHQVLNLSIQADLNKMGREYKGGLITHDEYAKRACELYSYALKGVSSKKIDALADDYLKMDEQYVYNSIKKIFNFLNKKDVDIIIISGAPTIIIEKYRRKFHFKQICAFKEETREDQFTGEVQYNYGFDKEKQVLKFIDQYNARPYMAFGDSESDIPLLKYAHYPFFVGKENLNKCYEAISFDDIFYKVEKILS